MHPYDLGPSSLVGRVVCNVYAEARDDRLTIKGYSFTPMQRFTVFQSELLFFSPRKYRGIAYYKTREIQCEHSALMYICFAQTGLTHCNSECLNTFIIEQRIGRQPSWSDGSTR